MKSPLVNHFGGPAALRQAITTEIVEPLKSQKRCCSGSPRYFTLNQSGPSEREIRGLRKASAQDRAHIYNYERERAQHLWHSTVFVIGERYSSRLAEFHNGAKVMTINTNHHPILVKILTSVMAERWPQIDVKFAAEEDTPNPSYGWDQPPAQDTLNQQVSYGYSQMPQTITWDPGRYFIV